MLGWVRLDWSCKGKIGGKKQILKLQGQNQYFVWIHTHNWEGPQCVTKVSCPMSSALRRNVRILVMSLPVCMRIYASDILIHVLPTSTFSRILDFHGSHVLSLSLLDISFGLSHLFSTAP